MQDRFYIAGQLRQIGRLFSVMGENPFKIRAYERAARALENITGDFDARIKERKKYGQPGARKKFQFSKR